MFALRSSLTVAVLGLAFAAGTESPAFLGRWSTGRVSTIQYRDSVTGAPAPTSGNNFAYDFKPDGSYSYTGLIQSTIYNCTTSVFSQENGKWTFEDGILRVRPISNPYKMTNSCAPSPNKEAPGKLIERAFRVRPRR